MDTEDAHTLQRESLDGETKNIVRTEDGVGEGCSHEGKIEKAITFKRTVYEEKEVEVEEEPNKYTCGNFQISFCDNDGGHGDKFTDFLATFQKVTNLCKPFSVVIKTEDNGEQEWKWGTKFRLMVFPKQKISESHKRTLFLRKKRKMNLKSPRRKIRVFSTLILIFWKELKRALKTFIGERKIIRSTFISMIFRKMFLNLKIRLRKPVKQDSDGLKTEKYKVMRWKNLILSLFVK